MEDESVNIPLEVLWNIRCKQFNKKWTDFLTIARCQLWSKKSKLVVEEGAVVGSAVEDGFSKADGSHSDTVGNILGGFGFDSEVDKE